MFLVTTGIEKNGKRTYKKKMCHTCTRGDSIKRRASTRGGSGNFQGYSTHPDRWYYDYGDSCVIECECLCHS